MATVQVDRISNPTVNGSLGIKAPCRVATTADIDSQLSQGALGAGGGGLITIDGVALNAGDRVLVKNQTDQTTNGIWVAQSTAWFRDVDANGNTSFLKGTVVLATDGATQAGLWFELTTANPITIGTSLFAFAVTSNPTVSGAMAPVVGAPSLGAARAALGSTTVGDAVFVASTAAVAFAALGPGRTLNTTAPLAGAGDLSADRTLTIDNTFLAHGQCRLTKSGANLLLSRHDGSKLIINGAVQSIPSAGVTLAPGSVTPSTLYYIYAFMNGATMTLEASTTAHATDSTTGVEIKSGDATRTLVGMARPIAGPAWQDATNQRFTSSYFNRQRLGLFNAFTANRSTSSTSFVELNTEIRIEFLVWSGEAVNVGASGGFQGSTTSSSFWTSIGFDGATAEETAAVGARLSGATVSEHVPIGLNLWKSGLAEGYHFATLLGLDAAGTTCTWDGGATAGQRCAMSGGMNG